MTEGDYSIKINQKSKVWPFIVVAIVAFMLGRLEALIQLRPLVNQAQAQTEQAIKVDQAAADQTKDCIGVMQNARR